MKIKKSEVLLAFLLFPSLLLLAGILLLERMSVPFETRADKEVIAANPEQVFFYEKLGLPRPDGSKEGNTPLQEQFVIEILLTKDRDQAQNAVDKLGNVGIDAFYTPLNRRGEVFYRVRAGVFGSRDQAEQSLEGLAKRGIKGKLRVF